MKSVKENYCGFPQLQELSSKDKMDQKDLKKQTNKTLLSLPICRKLIWQMKWKLKNKLIFYSRFFLKLIPLWRGPMKTGDIPETTVRWNLLFHPIHPTGIIMYKPIGQRIMFNSVCRSTRKFLRERLQDEAKMACVLVTTGHADSGV